MAPTPTIKDLGVKVKAKFPGQYDDLPDEELGRRVKEKHPGAYDDFSDTAPKPAAAEHSLGGFLSNVAGSAGNFVGDLAHAAAHPIDTLKAVGSIPVGLAEKAGIPVPAPGPGEQDAAKTLDAIADHFKGRYGSFDKAKEALYTDPIGVLGDVSVVAGGAGAAADAAKLGKVAKVAATISEFTDPAGLAAKAAKASGVTALAGKAADSTSKALTRGALRGGFNVNSDAAKVEGAVSAMNTGNVPFSQKGLDKVQQSLRDLQLQKEAVAGAHPGRIDPAAVETRLDDVASQKAWQVNPNTDVKQVEKVRQNFRERTGGQPILDADGKPTGRFTQGSPIPADEAQGLKEGTYANNKYGSAVPPQVAATAAAEKSLARGLKEELEAQLPELAGLNESQAKLLNLQGILEKAVNKYTNSNGFAGHLAQATVASKEGAMRAGSIVGAGALLHEPAVGAAVAVAHAILSDPAVKQRLATAINTARQSNPGKWASPGLVTATSRVSSYLDSINPEKK